MIWDHFLPRLFPYCSRPQFHWSLTPNYARAIHACLRSHIATSFGGWLRHFMAVRHGKEAVRIHPFSGASLDE
jgi:hypothetical protein